MYHPETDGDFFQETHYPEVRIFKERKLIEVRLFVRQDFDQKFLGQEFWTYQCTEINGWSCYSFFLRITPDWVDTAEMKALNHILNRCWLEGSSETIPHSQTSLISQMAFVSGENPNGGSDFLMGACGLWGMFSGMVTKLLKSLDTAEVHALEEYVSSRMKGAHKIIAPKQRLSRVDNRMHLYRGGPNTNPLPIFTTFGNCACLGTTSNALEYNNSFKLSPHNVDSYTQQFLLMVGMLTFWQRIRAFALKDD